jgi:hypothetical protein
MHFPLLLRKICRSALTTIPVAFFHRRLLKPMQIRMEVLIQEINGPALYMRVWMFQILVRNKVNAVNFAQPEQVQYKLQKE